MTTLGEPIEDVSSANVASKVTSARGQRHGPSRSWATTVPLLITGSAAVAAVVAVAWAPANGLDPTDEASYLQAVQTARRGDAFNGFFGLYTRPLWEVTAWNIAAVRLLGLALLVGVAVLLGTSVARHLKAPRLLVSLTTVAASTAYYATSWRTPSYNWLALVGAGLMCAATVRLLGGGHSRWAFLVGFGIALSAAGKVPTAGLLAVIAVAALRRHRGALVRAAAVAASMVMLHLTIVLPPTESLAILTRSAGLLKVVNPRSYSIQGAVMTSFEALVQATVLGLIGGGLFGLLPLAALRAGPHQLRRYRHLCLGAVVAAAIAALATSTWVGGMSHLRSGVGVTPILLCLGLAGVTGHLRGLADREGNQHQLALVMLFIASTAACLFGSNLSISWQLTLMGLLLVPACIAACYVFPIPVRTSIALAVIVTLGLGSAVVAVEARFDVRRSASWSASTVPVSLGRVTVRTDAETAQAFVELKQAATAAGWHQGVPLIDTTFTPAVPLALGAQVPPVLLPAFPGFATTSVCYAVQGLDAHWRNAWILMSTALTTQDRRRVTAYLGLRYPDDYVQVAEFDPPHSDLHGRLLRPRTPRAPDEPTARSGCLAPRPSR